MGKEKPSFIFVDPIYLIRRLNDNHLAGGEIGLGEFKNQKSRFLLFYRKRFENRDLQVKGEYDLRQEGFMGMEGLFRMGRISLEIGSLLDSIYPVRYEKLILNLNGDREAFKSRSKDLGNSKIQVYVEGPENGRPYFHRSDEIQGDKGNLIKLLPTRYFLNKETKKAIEKPDCGCYDAGPIAG